MMINWMWGVTLLLSLWLALNKLYFLAFAVGLIAFALSVALWYIENSGGE